MEESYYELELFSTLSGFFDVGMARHLKDMRVPPGGPVLNLGPGRKHVFGAIELGLPDWDANKERIPHGDQTFAMIIALHFLEHVEDPAAVLMECQRVLMPGGLMNIVVPYGAGHLAVQDMTHRHFFNEDSWRTLFHNDYYTPDGKERQWLWDINLNVIMGVKGSNLALLTQLVRCRSIPESTSSSSETSS